MVVNGWRSFALARRLRADIYHFHDPELIPYGVIFSISGKEVIYDVHENVSKTLLEARWIPKKLRWLVSFVFDKFEKLVSRLFFHVITATPSIGKGFSRSKRDVVSINNFPFLLELDQKSPWIEKRNEVCFIGGISQGRGIKEICLAIGEVRCGTQLNLVGQFDESVSPAELLYFPGWQRVIYRGVLGRAEVREVLRRSIAGLVTFHPYPNHLDAQPNKMFEYMSAGIPVIASDFPLWRKIITERDCGVLVDPLDPAAIARAIDFLVEHPDEARRLGENGRKAVEEVYNWEMEEVRLLSVYRKILS
jgi:glycosyltransferase involved in cell wall biosynthesis